MHARHGFGKDEKLKRKKLIDQVFGQGKAITVPPLRVIYRPDALGAPGIQAGVSAPSRIFKRAHQRNQVKRWLREAYRLQKAGLLKRMHNQGRSAAVFFIYTGKQEPAFDIIQPAMQKALLKLEQQLFPHETAE